MSKWFSKWVRKSKIDNESLLSAIKNIDSENNVDLGSGLYKVRVARLNHGKSGGYRALLVYKRERLALFVYGFAKNERDNLSAKELSILKKQAKQILEFEVKQIKHAITCGDFIKLESENER
jgi:hypothetical protein